MHGGNLKLTIRQLHDHLVAEQTKSYIWTVNEYQFFRAEKESNIWARTGYILLTDFYRILHYVLFRAPATTASIIGVSKMDQD
jgi:hypothetical protein